MAVKTDNYQAGRDFDSEAAAGKQIVAVVQTASGEEEDTVIGAGIVKQTAGGYSMTVEVDDGQGGKEQVEYLFNASGYPANEATASAGVKLAMAETKQEPVEGIVATAGKSLNREVDSSGTVKYTDTTGYMGSEISLDNLNARDQFAIQILKSILDKTKDPSNLNNTEVAYYCELAYNWAGYMMKESSEARAIIKDVDSSSNIQEEEVGYLSNTTEKLLNNIAAALDKTNAEILVTDTSGSTSTTQTHIAERITNPQLNKLIEDYVSGANDTTLGLKDLIAAIQGIGSGGGGGSSFDGNLTGWPSADLNIALGRGNSASSPLYVACNYPSKAILPTMLAGDVSGFLVFGSSSLNYPHGYFTFDNLKGAILNYLEDYSAAGGLNSLAGTVLDAMSAQDLYDKLDNPGTTLLKDFVDGRIKQFAADLKSANPSITIPNSWLQ